MTKKQTVATKTRGKRYELTEEGGGRIGSLLPKQVRSGRWADHRTAINGMFWVLNSGAP